jgi:hypothetical protein
MHDPDTDDNTLSEIRKLKLVARANKLFHTLRHAGTERDAAGNRELLFSHYGALILIGFFNPMFRSFASLQEASSLKHIQKRLGIKRVSKGSLCESPSVFDPALLVPIIEKLLGDLPQHHPGPGPHRNIPDSIPHELARKLAAVDGSAFQAFPKIVHALGRGDWKLHLQFRPLDGRPRVLGFAREHDADERDVLDERLESGCVYIADRGYERYALYNRIVGAGSDYVIRGQRRPADVLHTHPLTDDARQARVVSDEIVRLGPGQSNSKAAALNHAVRRIVIAKRHQARPRPDRRPDTEVVLYTNRIDLPADVVAAIYELRWSIELFFRFLKQTLNCRKLMSEKPNAAAIQLYCALIAALLLARVTGGPVTAKLLRILCLYMQGWADEEEVLAAIKRAAAARKKKDP